MEIRIYRWEENFYLNYHNEKELGFCDFIEEIKKDLLQIISKIRSFIVENSGIHFGIIYNDDEDNGRVINYETEEEFCVNGICVEKFVKDSLNCANECFKANVDENEWLKFKFRKDLLNSKNGVDNDDDDDALMRNILAKLIMVIMIRNVILISLIIILLLILLI